MYIDHAELKQLTGSFVCTDFLPQDSFKIGLIVFLLTRVAEATILERELTKIPMDDNFILRNQLIKKCVCLVVN